MTTISVTARGYTADLDTATGRVSISDDSTGCWAGSGHWDGNSIADCPAILGGDQDTADDIYDELDAVLTAAIDASTEDRDDADAEHTDDYATFYNAIHEHFRRRAEVGGGSERAYARAREIYSRLANTAWQPGCRPDELIAEMSDALDAAMAPDRTPVLDAQADLLATGYRLRPFDCWIEGESVTCPDGTEVHGYR